MSKTKKSFIVKFKTQQVVSLGLTMGVSSLLSIFYFDQKITHWIHNEFQGSLDSTARVITWFGLGDTYFLVSVFGYLLTRLFSEKLSHLSWKNRLLEAKNRFIFMLLCFSISGVIVMILKMVLGRARPYHSSEFHSLDFNPMTLNWDYQSFPSGHTQVGFTLASFISILYPRLTIGIFTFASLVGLSRVVLEKHYLGDVFAGAYIGILGTFLAWKWSGKKLLNGG